MGDGVFGEVHAGVFEEMLEHPVGESVVKIHASQRGIAAGGFDFKDIVAQLQDGDVKGSAAQVIHRDCLVEGLAKAVGQRGRGRLIDDADDLQLGDLARGPHRLPLRVVEICGDRDHGLADFLADPVLRDIPDVIQEQRGDFAQAVNILVHLDDHFLLLLRGKDRVFHIMLDLLDLVGKERPADQPLGSEHGIFGVDQDLPFRGLSDQAVALAVHGDHRRDQVAAAGVGDDPRPSPLHDRGARISGAQVNANDNGINHFALLI